MNFGNLLNIIDNTTGRTKATTEEIAEFFIHYVSGISIRESARFAGLNEDTCKNWRKTSWWSDVETMARKVASQNTDRKFSKIIDKAMAQINDRLDKGDPYTFQGKVSFKPINAKDLAWISGVLFDKRALVRGEPTTISESKTFEEKLDALGEKFSEIGKKDPDLKIVKK